VVRVSDY